MVANLNALRTLPNSDSLAHTELETKQGFFFFRQIDKYESMENAGVRPEYMFKNDIQRKRHPKFEKWCSQERLSASDRQLWPGS